LKWGFKLTIKLVFEFRFWRIVEMDNGKTIKGISLFEIAKPKFVSSQILIKDVEQKSKVELSKACGKLKVGRTGKIGYSK